MHVGLAVIDESAIVVLKIMQSKKGYEEESAVKPNSAVRAEVNASCRHVAPLFSFRVLSRGVFLSPRLLLGIVVSVRAGRWSRVIDCAVGSFGI